MSNNQPTKSAAASCKSRIWRNKATTEAPGTASSRAAATSRATMPGRRPTASTQDDLLPMAKLLDLADTWIMHQQQADAKARKEPGQPADREITSNRAGLNDPPIT